MNEFDELNNEDKEEKLKLGKDQANDLYFLGSWIDQKTDLIIKKKTSWMCTGQSKS